MRTLTWDQFAGAEGTSFWVRGNGSPDLELVLETAAELPASGREGGSFRLEFRGPSEPVLPQAIYLFERGGEDSAIFIVPVARDQSGTLYEAVFY